MKKEEYIKKCLDETNEQIEWCKRTIENSDNPDIIKNATDLLEKYNRNKIYYVMGKLPPDNRPWWKIYTQDMLPACLGIGVGVGAIIWFLSEEMMYGVWFALGCLVLPFIAILLFKVIIPSFFVFLMEAGLFFTEYTAGISIGITLVAGIVVFIIRAVHVEKFEIIYLIVFLVASLIAGAVLGFAVAVVCTVIKGLWSLIKRLKSHNK